MYMTYKRALDHAWLTERIDVGPEDTVTDVIRRCSYAAQLWNVDGVGLAVYPDDLDRPAPSILVYGGNPGRSATQREATRRLTLHHWRTHQDGGCHCPKVRRLDQPDDAPPPPAASEPCMCGLYPHHDEDDERIHDPRSY